MCVRRPHPRGVLVDLGTWVREVPPLSWPPSLLPGHLLLLCPHNGSSGHYLLVLSSSYLSENRRMFARLVTAVSSPVTPCQSTWCLVAGTQKSASRCLPLCRYAASQAGMGVQLFTVYRTWQSNLTSSLKWSLRPKRPQLNRSLGYMNVSTHFL